MRVARPNSATPIRRKTQPTRRRCHPSPERKRRVYPSVERRRHDRSEPRVAPLYAKRQGQARGHPAPRRGHPSPGATALEQCPATNAHGPHCVPSGRPNLAHRFNVKGDILLFEANRWAFGCLHFGFPRISNRKPALENRQSPSPLRPSAIPCDPSLAPWALVPTSFRRSRPHSLFATRHSQFPVIARSRGLRRSPRKLFG